MDNSWKRFAFMHDASAEDRARLARSLRKHRRVLYRGNQDQHGSIIEGLADPDFDIARGDRSKEIWILCEGDKPERREGG